MIVPSRSILLLHCTVQDLDKHSQVVIAKGTTKRQCSFHLSKILRKRFSARNMLFVDDHCLLVVFFCFIVLSKILINNSQVVIAGCYSGMFLAENLFVDDHCLLVVFFCFIVLSKILNNSQVVIAGCYIGMFLAENLFPMISAFS